MILIQLNDEDEDDGVEDDDADYFGIMVSQRCAMWRNQWGSHTAVAKPKGPKETATQSHGFTQCVWRSEGKQKSLTTLHTHTHFPFEAEKSEIHM